MQQNVLLGWHLKEILVAEFQITRAGGPLGKFDIARLHGHFKRRGLQQNVLLGWHFKEMLVRT